MAVSPVSSHERKFLNEHATLVLIGMKPSPFHTQRFVLPLCVRRRWRGPILHSRVDRSLVYFIHFTASRDSLLPCASLGAAHAKQSVNSARDWHPLGRERWTAATVYIWVQISLALLFSGQGMLVYWTYCQRVSLSLLLSLQAIKLYTLYLCPCGLTADTLHVFQVRLVLSECMNNTHWRLFKCIAKRTDTMD